MSWVDYDRDDRWSQQDLRSKARAVLALEFEDAEDLAIKAAQLATGNGFMTADERERWDAYVARKGELATQVSQEWARMQLLQQAMTVEAAQRDLYLYPALPEDDPDYLDRQHQRTALQLIVDAATPTIQALVDQRARVQPPQEEEEEQQ